MTVWQIIGRDARFETTNVQAAIDLEHPQHGIRGVSRRDAACPELSQARLLQITLPGSEDPEPIHEQYVRGDDLVAIYAATKTRPSFPEIYWRSLTGDDVQGWELIVSVHTGVLDDYPRIELRSHLPATEMLWQPLGDESQASAAPIPKSQGTFAAHDKDAFGCVIVRLPGGQLSYIETVFPSDFCHVDLIWQVGEVRIETLLFPERLEKGVIRRGRIRGWLVPTQSDFQLAQDLFRQFRDSQLPLRT